MRADDFGEGQMRIVQDVLRVDDALLGRVVERLCLCYVAVRAHSRLFARLGLAQQRTECVALGAIGRELIGGRQDGEIGLRHPQQQVLLRSSKTGLGCRRLKIRFLSSLNAWKLHSVCDRLRPRPRAVP